MLYGSTWMLIPFKENCALARTLLERKYYALGWAPVISTRIGFVSFKQCRPVRRVCLAQLDINALRNLDTSFPQLMYWFFPATTIILQLQALTVNYAPAV